MEHDAVVVGGGPAGLSAALWLARYRRDVVVFDSGEHRNRWVQQAHGYLGADPVDPAELRARARRDLARYETTAVHDVAVEAVTALAGGGFEVGVGGEVIAARRVILATGVRDVFPDVDGFFEHYGVQVFHCPSCDGYEARDQPVVVFGWSAEAALFALGLTDWASSVTVVTDGQPFEGEAGHRAALSAAGVVVLEDEAVSLAGRRGALRAVRLRGAGEVPCAYAFFSIAHEHASSLAQSLGCSTTEEGCLDAGPDGATAVPGLYAAGDIAPGPHLIQTAAASGARAGVTCAESLRPDLHQ